jgi:hypothetical protein
MVLIELEKIAECALISLRYRKGTTINIRVRLLYYCLVLIY